MFEVQVPMSLFQEQCTRYCDLYKGKPLALTSRSHGRDSPDPEGYPLCPRAFSVFKTRIRRKQTQSWSRPEGEVFCDVVLLFASRTIGSRRLFLCWFDADIKVAPEGVKFSYLPNGAPCSYGVQSGGVCKCSSDAGLELRSPGPSRQQLITPQHRRIRPRC